MPADSDDFVSRLIAQYGGVPQAPQPNYSAFTGIPAPADAAPAIDTTANAANQGPPPTPVPPASAGPALPPPPDLGVDASPAAMPAPVIPLPGAPKAPSITDQLPKIPYSSFGFTPDQLTSQAQATADAQAKYGQDLKTPAGIDSLWSKARGVHNPFLRALASIGAGGLRGLDGIYESVLPQFAVSTPGTIANRNYMTSVDRGNAASELAQTTGVAKALQEQGLANQTSLAPALKEEQNNVALQKLQNTLSVANDKNHTSLVKAGQRVVTNADGTPKLDADGQKMYELDPDSTQGKRIALATQVEGDRKQVQQSQIEKNKADIELKDAEAELKRAANDPTSPAYRLAVTKAATAQQNAGAASIRAEAYKNNYLMHAFGTDGSGAALPGATQIDNGKGGLTTVGTVNQGTVNKSIASQAAFEDTRQNMEHLRTAGHALYDAGGSLNDPAVVAALRDPHSGTATWVQGLVNSTLSPEQRNAVVAIASAREAIMPLRKLVGSGVSDSQVSALHNILPSGSTPDRATFDEKMSSFDRQFNALQGGLPQVNRGGGTPSPKSGGSNAPRVPTDKASGPGGHKLVSYDNQKTWHDAATGALIQ